MSGEHSGRRPPGVADPAWAEEALRSERRMPDTSAPPAPPTGLRRWVGVLQWAPAYERRNLRFDLVAGITVAAMLVPQAMAYALLAGLPPEVGLYASILPVALYALFGTSRQLAVGPVAIVSLLTASALLPYADEGTSEYIAAAALLALIVAVVHLVLGFGRLGFVVNFLSHSVLVGFTAAAALIIGFSQVKHLFGIQVERGEFFETVGGIVGELGETNLTTLAISVGAIATLVLLRRFAPKVPGALVVVVVTTIIVAAFDLTDEGVATVGEIPDSLPALGLPDADFGLLPDLIPAALVITLVGFMESIAIAKVFARRNRYEVDPNQELVSLGLANAAGGLSGGYPVTGGFSRTAVNADAGARTPLASLITAGLVLVTVAVLTPLFTDLPTATLASIVVVAVFGLIDVKEARHIWQVKRSDFLTLAVAFAATLTLGIEIGIAVAVAVSLGVVFARIARPHSAELGRVPGTDVYRNVDRFPEVETRDDVVILRIDVALSFANVSFLKRRLNRLQREHPGVRAIVLDFAGVNDVDASAEQALHELLDEFDERGVALHLASVKGPVRDVLIRSGLWERLGVRLHATVSDAVAAAVHEQEPAPDRRMAGIDERG